MIKEFETLTIEEAALLLKAPVVFSVYTLSAFKHISKAQKEDAIKLVHIKTFTEHYQLIPYYEEADKNFRSDLEGYIEQFFPFELAHCNAIKKDMEKINSIIDKMDKVYGGLLRKSLEGFVQHIKKAAHNVLQDIIFPITFSKL